MEISGREKRQRYLNDDEEEEVSELPDSYQRPPSVNLDVNGDAPSENNTPIPGSLRTEGQISIDQGLIQQLVNTLLKLMLGSVRTILPSRFQFKFEKMKPQLGSQKPPKGVYPP